MEVKQGAPVGDDLTHVKAEIIFFMDKIFQVSFAYFAAVFAFLVLSESDTLLQLSVAIHGRVRDLIALAILAFNLTYTVIAFACLYAVLKRGLFILRDFATPTNSFNAWERFLRSPAHAPPRSWIRALTWNMDNYYMIPLFVAIPLVSVLAFTVAILSPSVGVWVLAVALMSIHLLPGAMLWNIWKLSRECSALAEKQLVRGDQHIPVQDSRNSNEDSVARRTANGLAET
jgi:hypothetical protein